METGTIAARLVRQDVPELATLQNAKAYQLREKVNMGEKLNRAEKNRLAEAADPNAYFKRAVALVGCRFGFGDALKSYNVKQ